MEALEEMANAENYLVKRKQEYLLIKQKEIPSNSKLIGLYPRLDGDGVMQSDG